MQAREFGAAAQSETAGRGNPGTSTFKSKKPLALIATPDLDLWGQLGPMLEATCSLRHADSLSTAASMLKPGARTILVADLRGQKLGERMILWAGEQCRARDCKLVQLTSSATRTDAHRFYARLGFVQSHVGMKLQLRD